MLPKDYIGKLVEVKDNVVFVDERVFNMVGIIVSHEGPKSEQIQRARTTFGEDQYHNYNHLYKVVLTTGEEYKLFSDEFVIVGE